MTAIATAARQAAVSFEAKKTGFGQAQDGWSLTLRIQDNDVPDGVAKAKKGTRYQVALVEIGDNEEPVSPQLSPPAHVEATPRPVHSTPVPAGDDKPRKSPAQIAGYLCTLPSFHVFLRRKFTAQWNGNWSVTSNDEDTAKECVYDICAVTSRTQLTNDNTEWHALQLAFRLWENHPELEDVPA